MLFKLKFQLFILKLKDKQTNKQTNKQQQQQQQKTKQKTSPELHKREIKELTNPGLGLSRA